MLALVCCQFKSLVIKWLIKHTSYKFTFGAFSTFYKTFDVLFVIAAAVG